MRPIKFRAWVVNERNGFLGRNDLFEANNRMIYDFITWDGKNVKVYELKGADKCVLMQYTGLKDKNGKEVYEGDIVKYSWLPKDHPQHETGVVVVEDIRNIPSILTKGWTFEIEVIGNIYENPELLEEIKRMGDDKE